MARISVIVPVYKAENFIHRCVDSILSQTFSDFELILVDDGSPDNCGVICDEYAEKDSRIRVIHQENQGQAAARNRAVTEARGEWVCFVDSDDSIHPQMVEHLYRATMEHGTNISACGIVEEEQLPGDFNQLRKYAFASITMDEAGMEALYHEGEHRYWVPCGKLIRREILLKHPFQPGRIYEDNAVVCQWLHESGTIANSLERYYFYQINPGSTTKNDFSLKRLDFLWALQEQIRFYDALGFERMKQEAIAYYLKAGSWYLPKVCDVLHDRKTAARLRRDMRRRMRSYPPEELPLTKQECEHIRRVTPSVWQRILRKLGCIYHDKVF